MEPRFGHDFSRVRIHVDGAAADSARAVGAHAYTLGQHIVFGAGQYHPQTDAGRRLLAHELTHVVQQGPGVAASPVAVGPAEDSAEREAEALAARAVDGGPLTSRTGASHRLLQRQPCRALLDEPEVARVNGVDAHRAIGADFEAQAGGNARHPTIPGGSFSAYRTTCGDDPEPTTVWPVIYGRGAGLGIPDLAYQADESLELAEIKPGLLQCVPEGELQVRNYVSQGNRARGALGVRSVRMMPTSRFAPTSPLPVGGQQVSVTWCGPGLLVYKAIRHPDVFLCSEMSDRGRVDTFLERALSQAQGTVDRYIDQVMDPAITRAIQTLSLRQAINWLWRYGRQALADYVAQRVGGGAGGRAVAQSVVQSLPGDQVVDAIANWIQQQVGEQAVQELRNLAQTVKSQVLNGVRRRLQADLRNMLQESLTAVCAGAATVTIAMLLRQLARDMARFFGRKLGEVIVETVNAAVRAIQRALVYALLAVLAVVAVVLIIVFLPEILAALGAAAAWILGALAALGPLLARLLPQIPDLLPSVQQLIPSLP